MNQTNMITRLEDTTLKAKTGSIIPGLPNKNDKKKLFYRKNSTSTTLFLPFFEHQLL